MPLDGVGEGGHLLDDLVDALDLFTAQRGDGLGTQLFRAARHELKHAVHGGQWVGDLVGDPRCHLAHADHFFVLDHGLLLAAELAGDLLDLSVLLQQSATLGSQAAGDSIGDEDGEQKRDGPGGEGQFIQSRVRAMAGEPEGGGEHQHGRGSATERHQARQQELAKTMWRTKKIRSGL